MKIDIIFFSGGTPPATPIMIDFMVLLYSFFVLLAGGDPLHPLYVRIFFSSTKNGTIFFGVFPPVRRLYGPLLGQLSIVGS